MNELIMQIEPQSVLPTERLRSSVVSACARRDELATSVAWTYPGTGAATPATEVVRIAGIRGEFGGTSVVNGVDLAIQHVQAKAFDLQHQGSAPGGPPR